MVEPEDGRSGRRRRRGRLATLLIVTSAVALLRLLALTWRVRKVNPETLVAVRGPGRPVIFAFWHAHILPLMYVHRHEGITVLISEHSDGELITRVAKAFGFQAVRGSSTRGAVRGLVGLVRAARDLKDGAVTPDGPRGPAREFAPGVIAAAQKAQVPLVPIAASASSMWQLRSWDRFVVPKPFAMLTVAYGDPSRIDPAVDPTDRGTLDFYRAALQNTCSMAGER